MASETESESERESDIETESSRQRDGSYSNIGDATEYVYYTVLFRFTTSISLPEIWSVDLVASSLK